MNYMNYKFLLFLFLMYVIYNYNKKKQLNKRFYNYKKIYPSLERLKNNFYLIKKDTLNLIHSNSKGISVRLSGISVVSITSCLILAFGDIFILDQS